MLELKNLIDGKATAPSSGRYTEKFNPATGEKLADVPSSDASDVDRAVRIAGRAFQSWRLTPAPKRGEILYRVGRILEERKEALARLMTQEMGKVLTEARGDVQEAIDMAYYMGGEGRRSFGYTTPSELPDKFAFAMRDPIGVAAVITPWNFPAAIPSWKMFPALVLGNTVVFKPASDTPLVAGEMTDHVVERRLADDIDAGPGSSPSTRRSTTRSRRPIPA